MTTVRFSRLRLLVKDIGPALDRMGEVEWYKVERRQGVVVAVLARFTRVTDAPYELGRHAQVVDAKPPRPRRARKRTHDRRRDEYVEDDGERAYALTHRDFAQLWSVPPLPL